MSDELLTLQQISESESKKLIQNLNYIEKPLSDVKLKNIKLNNAKKDIYMHLLSLENNKHTMNDVNFAIRFENIKDNLPRQISLFNGLKNSIETATNEIHMLYSIHNSADYQIGELMKLSESIRKNNFEMNKQIDILIKILTIEKDSLKFIDDSRVLSDAYKTHFSNSTSAQRRSSETELPKRGFFGGFRFKRQITHEEQISHAKDFLNAFDQERKVYLEMEKLYKKMVVAVGEYEKSSKDTILSKKFEISENQMDDLRKIASVALFIPAFVGFLGSAIGFGAAIGTAVTLGIFSIFIKALISEWKRSETFKASPGGSIEYKKSIYLANNLSSKIKLAFENQNNIISKMASEVISSGQNIKVIAA